MVEPGRRVQPVWERGPTSGNAAETILVAVDYEPLSILAVEHAVELGRRLDVVDLHCVHVDSGASGAEQNEMHRHTLSAWLAPHLARAQGFRHLIGHCAQGDVAEQIVQLAADLDADWVILATHGRRGLARALLGSVAEKVVRTCDCAVIVVRDKERTVEEPGISIFHKSASPDPVIAPICPRCAEARQLTEGTTLWCEQHRERHGRRHTYYDPRSSTWSTERLIK